MRDDQQDAPESQESGGIQKRESALSPDVKPGAIHGRPTAAAETPRGLVHPSRHGEAPPLTAAQEASQQQPSRGASSGPGELLGNPAPGRPAPPLPGRIPPTPVSASAAPAASSGPSTKPLATAGPTATQRAEKAARKAAPDSLSHTAASPRHQLEAWLAMMVQKSASDLILRAGGRPCVRVDGRIHFMPGRVPGAGPLQEVLEGIVGPERMKGWAKTGSADVALELDGLGRFRLNAYRQMGNPAVVLRRIAEDPPELESLALPTRDLQQLSMRKRGIILVTGIAGSGKSTTLAAMIEHMNRNTERHVVTLEDPVEMIFTEDRCVISQREIGTDCSSFSDGLRHSLRQSPDVILIGEMRDAETIAAALDATETGHLVMSTLHTVNAPQTVDRILSFFRSEQHEQVRQRLAENLAGVLSQRLLPLASGAGMVPAIELMSSTPRVRELLEKGRTAELARAIEGGGEEGLISFNQSLRDLVTQNRVDLETALAASDKPDELLLALRGFKHRSGAQKGRPGTGFRMAGGE